jgi:hypothetical protein
MTVVVALAIPAVPIGLLLLVALPALYGPGPDECARSAEPSALAAARPTRRAAGGTAGGTSPR